MAKYLSNRQKNLKIGISSYTESNTVLEVTGKVGVGTTNAQKAVHVAGFGTQSGGIRLGNLDFFAFGSDVNGSGSPTFKNSTPNGDTVLRVIPNGTGKSQFEFFGNDLYQDFTAWDNVRIVSSPTEFRIDSAYATNGVAKPIRIETNVSGGGGTFNNPYQLYLATNGNIGIGTSILTGTASQRLQVSGGAYVSGNVGIGTTNPTETGLSVLGKVLIHQDSGSNNRIIFRGQPGSSYRWNIDNYGSANDFRIFREDDATTANGAVYLGISTTGTVSATRFSGDGSLLTGITASSAISIAANTANQNQYLTYATSFGSTTGLGATSALVFNPSTGNLGIGSLIPSVKLDVVGDAKFTGDITVDQVFTTNNGNSQNIRIGDDAWIGDLNVANTLRISGSQDGSNGFVVFGNQNGVALGRTGTGPLYYGGNVNIAGIVTAPQLSTGESGTGVNISTNTISGPATLIIDPAAVGDNTGAVRIRGDLFVDGSQFIVNSTTVELADFNVGIATTVGTNALLDGAGIGIGSIGIRKTITWNNTANALTSSEDWNLASGKQYEINGTSVLSSTTLGSGVVNSSLTSVGTLGQLNVSGDVGIGTNVPRRKLHLRTSNADGIYLDNSDQTGNSGAPVLRVRGQRIDGNTSQSFSGQLVLEKWRMDASIQSGQNLGAIVFGGNHHVLPGITTGITYGASIGAIAEGTFSDAVTAPTAIVFNTGTVGVGTLALANLTYGTEAARITSNRNLLIGATSESGTASQRLQVTGGAYVSDSVGIGVTNPQDELHLGGTSNVGIRLQDTAPSGGSYATINYNDNGSGTNALDISADAGNTGTNTEIRFNIDGSEVSRYAVGGQLLVGSSTTTGTATQRLQVTGGAYVSGNLGVGITNPAEKVDVIGNYIKVKNNADSAGGVVLDTGNTSAQIAQIFLRDRGTDKFTIRKNASNNFDIFNNATSSASLTIDVAGNVLVGTATSTGTVSQPLQVTGGAYVSGNLGIGATNPSAILDIRNGSPWFRPNETGAKASALRLGRFSDSINAAYDIITDDVGGDTLEIQSNRYTGQLRFSRGSTVGYQTTFILDSHFTSGTSISIADTTGNTTKIKIDEAGNTFFNNTGSVLVGTISSTNTVNQKLQVTGGAYVSGNLGVGATNPQSNTQVAIAGTLGISEVSGSGARTLFSSSGSGFVLNHNDNSNINIQSQGSNRLAYQVSSNSWVIPSGGTSLVVGTGGTTGTASQSLQVTGGAYVSGNLGIGRTNPSVSLHITGGSSIGAILERNTIGESYIRYQNSSGTMHAGISTGATFWGIGDSINFTTLPYFAVTNTTGNVGIATTNPLQKLHVLGNLLVAAGSSTGQHITQKAYELNSGTLSWEGSAGQLFSITNNLTTGSIFSVNDVSGIPSIDVDANGTVRVAPFGGNVGVGTTNATEKLDLVGNLRISGGLVAGAGAARTTGTAGQVLKSTGTGLEWGTASGGSSGTLLTIGVRVGSAVTFSLVGTGFTVSQRVGVATVDVST